MKTAIEALCRRCGGALSHRAAPYVVGLLTSLLVLGLWGGLNPLPWVYDEAAYLLQAQIFATGRWAVPGPPMPEFFEQMHVFVTPDLVPKYPPGHALSLVPGVWLGATALVPLLVAGLTGGLLFAATRRLANQWVALVAWTVWITAPEELYIRPSYMAQTSSGLVWLAAWLVLWRWKIDGRGRWLIGFGALAALGVITRPVTALAFLVPAACWIGWRLTRDGRWRQAVPAAAVAVPILALAPWWSYSATGRAFPTPYSEYSRVYAPWNMPGFQVDRSPPLRTETPAMAKFRREWLPLHDAHSIDRVPAILWERLRGLAVTFWGDHGIRWWLLAAFAVGVVACGPELRFLLGSSAALVLAYLTIAARPLWTVYYLEAFPVLGVVTATGVWVIARRAARVATRRPEQRETFAGGLILLGLIVAVPGTVDRLLRAREQQVNARLIQTDLQRAIDSLPGRSIVFVETGPRQRPFESYVRNAADLERAPVWVVQDRGPDNRRLAEFAGRTAYRFDPGTGRILPGAGR